MTGNLVFIAGQVPYQDGRLSHVGKHARFAVGVPSLPFDAAVEIDAVFEIG